MTYLLREYILPPGCLIALLGVCIAVAGRFPKAARGGAAVVLLALFALSTAPLSHALSAWAESEPPLDPQRLEAFAPQAIVVLGAGAHPDPAEFDAPAVPSTTSWMRVVYAAEVARATELPVLTSGGYGDTPMSSEAAAMAWALGRFGVDTEWVESQSTNTQENAELSAPLLKKAGVERILLVTSASHARRARLCFEREGLQVLSAPTEFRIRAKLDRGYLGLLPSGRQFYHSSEALRALLAEAWYRLARL